MTKTTTTPRAKSPMTSKRANHSNPWKDRVDGGDWDRITGEVNEYGGALTPQLLTPEEAASIAALYEQDEYFRPTINMGRHTRDCCRSPVTGMTSSAVPRRGLTPSTSGWECATRPGRPSQRRSC